MTKKIWLPDCARWLKRKDMPALHFEDVRQNTPQAVAQLVAFIKHNLPPEQIERVRAKYDSEALDTNTADLLHLNKARVERYRDVRTPAQQSQCATAFAPHLLRMGYPVN